MKSINERRAEGGLEDAVCGEGAVSDQTQFSARCLR